MSETCRAFYHQLFGVRRSVRYHQRRQSYFEACHTFIAALQVIFGSSSVAAILSNSGIWVGVSLAAAPYQPFESGAAQATHGVANPMLD